MLKHFYALFCVNIHVILLATIPNVQCGEVKLQNWIQVSKDSWPADDSGSKQPFYFIHADEYQSEGRSFDFSSTFFSTISNNLVKNPYLKFKYWTSTDKSALRYKSSHPRPIVTFSKIKQWSEKVVKNLDQNDWSQLNFFINDPQLTNELFTTAFKDVQVEYIDRQPLETFTANPVHGHKGQSTNSPNIEVVVPLKNLQTPPNLDKSRLLVVFQNWAEVVLPSPVTVELTEEDKPDANIELLKFQLQALPNGNKQLVTLRLEQWENACQNDLQLMNSYIECTIVEQRDKASQGRRVKKTLKSFRIFLTGLNTDFAIWNAESVFASASASTTFSSASSKTPTPVKLITTSAPVEKFRYNVKPASASVNQSFVNIVESLSENKDWCYSVASNDLPSTAKMEVYLTLDGAPQGVQIASLTAAEASLTGKNRFCINDYLPFANLARYQLTVAVDLSQARATSIPAFSFDYSKQAADSGKDFKLLGPALSKLNLTANQWLHFDASIDYSITVPKKANSKLAFHFCDQTLNCFSFEEDKDEADKEGKNIVYKLPEFAQSVLARSSFMRLKIDNFDQHQLDSYTFEYFSDNSKAAFKKLTNKQSKPGPLYSAAKVCPPNFEADEGGKASCKLTSAYQSHTVKCDLSVGCSNIFSSPLLTTTRYYSELTDSGDSVTYLPYQTAAAAAPTDAFLAISLNDAEKGSNQDVCVSFRYLARSSPLFIATTHQLSNGSLELPVMGESSTATSGHACTSWFARSAAGKVDNFTLRFKQSPGVPLTNIDGHQVILSKSTPIKLNSFPQDNTLEQGIFRGNDLNSIFLPSQDAGGLIRATKESIEYLLPRQQQQSGQQTQVSYLRSKWIRMSAKLQNRLLLSWTATSSATWLASGAAEASLIVSQDGGLDLLTLQGQAFLTPQTVNQLATLAVDYIRLTIKVKVNLTAAAATSDQDLSLKLTDFLLNDPCYLSEDPSVKVLIDCQYGGKCGVDDYSSYTRKCNCLTGYSGADCSEVDYCIIKNGNADCIGKFGGTGCISTPSIQDYKCGCSSGKSWDLSVKGCLPTSCKVNEEAKYNPSKREYVCDCITEAIKLDGECQIYDACNLKHRQANGKSTTLCSDSNASCQPTSEDFECICPEGTFNEDHVYTSAAKCIPNQMRNCTQGYVPKKNATKSSLEYECICNSGYTPDGKGACTAKPSLDVSRCTPKEGQSKGPAPFLASDGKACQCPPGFFYDEGKGKVCLVDQKFAPNYGCAVGKLELKADGGLGCACLAGQKFDTVARSCRNECDDSVAEKCRSGHRAGCSFDKKPNCECDSIKEVKLVSDDAKQLNWKCASKCDVLLKSRKFEENSCTGDFTYCEPAGMTEFGGLLRDSVFSLNSSTIKSSKMDYCKCKSGFKPSRDDPSQCVVNTGFPMRYIRGMQFDSLAPNASAQLKASFLPKVQAAFTVLIADIFNASLVKRETHCEVSSSESISCTTGFEHESSEEVIRRRLNETCRPVEKNGKKCFYSTRSPQSRLKKRSATSGVDLSAILFRDTSSPIPVSTIDYCEKSRDTCYHFANSKCTPTTINGQNNQQVPSFNCTCNTDYYNRLEPPVILDPKTQKPIKVADNSLLHPYQTLERCTPKDFCDEHSCSDRNATCHSQIELEAENFYNVKIFCLCPESNRALSNNSFHCQPSCTAEFCSGHGQCARDINDEALIGCRCSDGWTGPRCEWSVGSKSVTGLLVGTIVVSLVAVLSIVAIVVVYMRRKDELPLEWQIARKIQRGGRRGDGGERRRGSHIRAPESQGHQQAGRQRYPSWGDDQ